jgi:hypothetical protein
MTMVRKYSIALVALAVLGFAAVSALPSRLLAQVPGAQVLTSLNGSEYIANEAGTVSTVMSTKTLANYTRVAAGTSTTLGTTGTVSLDPTKGNLFTVTPTANITLNAASAPIGAVVYVVVTTSGTSSFSITPTTNFKSTGALATGTTSGKVFTITFVGDGTNMNEVARTAAM